METFLRNLIIELAISIYFNIRLRAQLLVSSSIKLSRSEKMLATWLALNSKYYTAHHQHIRCRQYYVHYTYIDERGRPYLYT
jgi:hypothetical protein